MARIISGGLKSGSSRPYKKEESYKEEYPQDESWGAYALRNIAKTPAMAYGIARSGLGAGNIADLVQRRLPNLPGNINEQGKKNLRNFLPTYQQAVEEEAKPAIGKLSNNPEYYTESRPGDYPAEFLLTEAPFLGKAALKGGAALGKKALESAGLFAGANVGREVGGAAGEYLGDPELGEAIGGYGGAYAGLKGARLATNRPSKTIEPHVYDAEWETFEEGKQERIGALRAEEKAFEKNKQQQIQKYHKNEAAFEKDRQQRVSKIEKEHGAKHKELGRIAEVAITQLPRAKHEFEAQKQKDAKRAENEIVEYDKNIKNIEKERKPLYNKAQKLEGNAVGDASHISTTIQQVEQNMTKGVSAGDQKLVRDLIAPLAGDAEQGTLSLRDMKIYQKNLNAELYGHGASTNFKRLIGEVVDSLNKSIEETGSKQHTKAWQASEAKHKELVDLKKNRKEFIQAKKQEIGDIKQGKFPIEQEIHLEQQAQKAKHDIKLHQAETKKQIDAIKKEKFNPETNLSDIEKQKLDNSKAIDAIGKETYDEMVKNKAEQEQITNTFDKLLNDMGNSKYGKYLPWGIGGLGSVLSALGFGPWWGGAIATGAIKTFQSLRNQWKTAQSAFKTHPDIYMDFVNLVKDIPKVDYPHIAAQVALLGKKVEETEEDQESKPRARITSGGLKKR